MLLQIKSQNQNLTEKKRKSGMIDMNWKQLTTLEQLDEIDSISQKRPVFIFKHSTRCSISAAALSRLERKFNPEKAPSLEAHFLDLIAHRDVSNAIADRYGVEHQSPQVLLIQNGQCTYDSSHLGISFDEIIENITPLSV